MAQDAEGLPAEWCAAEDECYLDGMRPEEYGARPGGLESPEHVEITVRVSARLQLAAEVEVLLQGVTERPSAVAGQKRSDRLSLAERDVQVVGSEGRWRALNFTHKAG